MINMIIKFARNRKGFIGKDGKLPWKCREDLADFKKATEGNVVIMGRTTWISIGKPLPNRDNIVVSNNRKFVDQMNGKYKEQNNLIFVRGLLDAIRTAKMMASKYDNDMCKVYVIGGAKLIESVLRQFGVFVDKIEISEIDDETTGDCQINDVLLAKFKGITETKHYEVDHD